MKTISLIAILAAVFVAHAWDPAPVVVPVQGGGTATTSKFGDGYTSRARAAGRPIRPPSLAAGQSPATARATPGRPANSATEQSPVGRTGRRLRLRNSGAATSAGTTQAAPRRPRSSATGPLYEGQRWQFSNNLSFRQRLHHAQQRGRDPCEQPSGWHRNHPAGEEVTVKNSIFILTGAGISAESGIQTFRGESGLWEGHRVEDVASPAGFHRDPALVFEFYNVRRAKIREAQPNAAHLALARLEREFSGTVTVVTQNIDDLHERAGSRNVIHMHGEALKARCRDCRNISPCENNLDETNRCPTCHVVGRLRPHIVWFGEMPLFMDEIYLVLSKADLFISIGTSGQVYPAAGFAEAASQHGIRTIEVNPASTKISPHFDEHLRGAAGQKVTELVGRLLEPHAG